MEGGEFERVAVRPEGRLPNSSVHAHNIRPDLRLSWHTGVLRGVPAVAGPMQEADIFRYTTPCAANRRDPPGQKAMMMIRARYSPALVALLLAVGGLSSIPALSTAAHAASCSGGSCPGLDPVAAGCDDDAITVATTTVAGTTVELRWSGSCNANWAEAQTTADLATIEVHNALEEVQSTGNADDDEPEDIVTPMVNGTADAWVCGTTFAGFSSCSSWA
ncbi:DUF2690 domain-containing protein [Kitasatospora sp. NPDC052896]|uniref:DUF2690 domain-containing protein n=1 Tax=Kitasatospora sp. NPDC052896 TaxID=3364061 RepID=UPI0037C62BFD